MKLFASCAVGLIGAAVMGHITTGWAFGLGGFIFSWVMLAFLGTTILTYRAL